MNKQYIIQVVQIDGNSGENWWRIVSRGSHARSLTSETYTRKRDARRAAELFVKSILKAPSMEIVEVAE